MTRLPHTLRPNEPTILDLKAIIKKEVMLDLAAHHVGVIEAFDPSTQTATVRIVYKRTFFAQSDNGTVKPELKPFPILADVPVVFLSGGPASLRFPVAKGDECILLFADRDIDKWYESGDTESGCNTLRLHSLSDAFAVVGLRNALKPLTEFPTDRAGLIWGRGDSENSPEAFVSESAAGLTRGDTKVLAGEKVTFQNTSTTLKTELQRLIDELTNLNTHISTLVTTTAAIQVAAFNAAVTNAAAFPPIATSISNVTTQLADIKDKFGELLE